MVKTRGSPIIGGSYIVEHWLDRFVRDKRANYHQTLSVLQHVKRYKPSLISKTSIQLGHGETDEQILRTMKGKAEVSGPWASEAEG